MIAFSLLPALLATVDVFPTPRVIAIMGCLVILVGLPALYILGAWLEREEERKRAALEFQRMIEAERKQGLN